MGKLRYWIPNALTAAGIGFAALSLQSSIEGRHRAAAWWILFTVLTDKADGAVARALKASSAFGGQLDSFADFFSFGIAPTALFYSFFTSTPSAGWSDPQHRLILGLIAAAYIICVAVRLARFNITAGSERFFFGVPTTFVGGVLTALFLSLLKYGDPAWTASGPSGDHWRMLGGLQLGSAISLFPYLLPLGAIAMVSTLRMPKIGRTGRPLVDALQFGNLIIGYAFGLSHRVPEYFVIGAMIYFAITIRYHLTNEVARASRLPPLFGQAGPTAVPAVAEAVVSDEIVTPIARRRRRAG